MNRSASTAPSTRMRRGLASAGAYAALILLALIFVAPFGWMISTSLKPEDQIFTEQIHWIPRPIQWSNYAGAVTTFPFLLYLRNTLFVCFMTMAGSVLSASVVAYGFSRLRWRGRDTLFFLLIATMMLPAQVTMLPVFLVFRWLGWTGTFLPLVVPPFLGTAFYVFLLRQFFLTIPQELSDSARIDGCGELAVLRRVIAPLAKPALATVALFSFTGAWMDFLGPLIYLHDEEQYTLAIGLQAFLGRHGGEWAQLMAASAIVTLPMLILFFFAQRTFIRGIALTGLKG